MTFMNGGEMSMRLKRCTRLAGTRWLVAVLITFGVPWSAGAQDKPTQQTTVDVTPGEPQPSLEIYGFAMLDIGHDFKQINPNWNDTGALELGMTFTSDVVGAVNGVRFYKGVDNTGTHTGSLWSASGTLLASRSCNSAILE